MKNLSLLPALLVATLLSPAVWAAPASSGRPQKLASPDSVPEGLSAPEWSSIRQQYEQHRRATFPVDGGYQARNPGQQWRTRFDGRGFLTRPDAGGWQWGLELRSYGFAGSERTVSGQPRVNTVGPRVTYDWDATLQEWFVNDRHGLEHGFTVRERPATEPKHSTFNIQQPTSNDPAAEDFRLRRQPEHDAALVVRDGQVKAPSSHRSADALQDAIAPLLNSHPSTLNFLLAVRGDLRPEVQADGRGMRFVDAQGAAALTYSELTVRDADGRKLPARFELVELERGVHAASTPESEGTVKRSEDRAPQTGTALLRLVIDERGARYPLTIDPIAQQAYLKASNTGALDNFGNSVAVSGDTVVVGASGEDSNATGVNGDGSDNSLGNAGAAYVFVRDGTTWTQQAYLKASNTDRIDNFGTSVAISGDTVVVGAHGEASNATGVNGDESDNSAQNSGAAYVFVRNGTIWSQQAYLKASNTEDFDQFGYSVAVSGDTVVVGANEESSNATGVNGDQSDNSAQYSGAAYVFVRNGTTWTQQAYLKASNTDARDYFGDSVAVSGDTVVVGAYEEDSNATGVNGNQTNNLAQSSGAAYVFVRSGTTWSQQAYLKASSTNTYNFGYSVAASGDTVVVGAPDSGAAYVFMRNGTTWSQQAYLRASNTNASEFGWSVAVSGDTVVVGAFWENSNATGVNGDQSDNSAILAGAAYVFVRSGTTWTQQAYLKASNTGGGYVSGGIAFGGDRFGSSVAVSSDTVVVGAYGEDSNATGVNGNQSDNSALDSGAAYIFTGLGLGPSLAFTRDGSGGYFLRLNGVPDLTYRLQRAPSVTGPWGDIATNTAPASGLVEFHDLFPPSNRAFYRTLQQ